MVSVVYSKDIIRAVYTLLSIASWGSAVRMGRIRGGLRGSKVGSQTPQRRSGCACRSVVSL
eukprot:scaffold48595_cov68-Phaeocystis_antarctica.AAC.4